MSNPFRYFNSSPEVIRLVVMNTCDTRCRCATSRICWPSAGSTSATRPSGSGGTGLARCSPPRFVSDASRTCAAIRSGAGILDEVFVKVNGKLCYLWRAVDHEGEVLEAVATAKRDKAAALKLLKRIMKKYGAPRSIVTDGLRAYSAAMNEIGVAAERHEVGGRLNNRAENSHQPFRCRERAMQRFRSLKTLQKFSSVHAQVHNHFNLERHLVARQVYKQRRSAALAEWHALVA